MPLSRRHFTLVTFMIISCKMQNPVQSENLNFLTKGMPQRTRVTSRSVERDGNVSGKTIVESGRGKREYVRRMVLAAETRVQRTHLAAVCHHHAHRPLPPRRPAGL